MRKLLKKEQGHTQYFKQFLNIFILALIILVSLLRGGSDTTSIIGIETCSSYDWIIISSYVFICIVITVIAVKIVKR